jgi:hypothetical protein
MTKRLDSCTALLVFTSIVPRLLLKRKLQPDELDGWGKEGMEATEIARPVGCKRGNVYKALNAAELN